jgi:hypothetical protein
MALARCVPRLTLLDYDIVACVKALVEDWKVVTCLIPHRQLRRLEIALRRVCGAGNR